MLSLRSLLFLILAAASAASAEIVCSTTPISKGTLAVIYEPYPYKKGPHLTEKEPGSGFETRGEDASTIVWSFQCDSKRFNNTVQNKIPQARYGLMVIADGPNTIPSPDARCLAVKFDEGFKTKGSLISQPCSLEDDESQINQFFSLWKTEKPETYYQSENFMGYSHKYYPDNPYPYGAGYTIHFQNETGSQVRALYRTRLLAYKTMLTLVEPRH